MLTNAFADCDINKAKGSGDLGLIIERANGSILIINHSLSKNSPILCRITGLGDLSHASAVFSRDQRYAFIFGRDGGLTKVDLLSGTIVKRVMQAGNSIGGAISQDGKYVAVSNYEPGGVNIFSSTDLQLIASIPATFTNKSGISQQSKTVGLVDAPNNQLLFALFDAGEIWQINLNPLKLGNNNQPTTTKYKNIGLQPYDALMSDNGRYYIAGLFGEDGLALLDLWYPEKGVQRILDHYGKGKKKLPVYKMPHLEGWAIAGDKAFLPAVGQHELLVVDSKSWKEVKRIKVHSQPVFAMASPDQRQIWVNFAFPDNNTLQVIDSKTLKIIKEFTPGKGILHMEFTPRGEHVWVSVRDKDQVIIYDTNTLKEIRRIDAQKPSGIFFSVRAAKIGL
ncbi:MAG: cytochrome D1 domain-containing protein [Pseudomonadota bacterium]